MIVLVRNLDDPSEATKAAEVARGCPREEPSDFNLLLKYWELVHLESLPTSVWFLERRKLNLNWRLHFPREGGYDDGIGV